MRNAYLTFLALPNRLVASATADSEESAGQPLTGWFDSVRVQAGIGTHWSNDDDHTVLPVLGG
jgi:hypothetical protein